jgi:Zn-finger nucleic acid-binding protein
MATIEEASVCPKCGLTGEAEGAPQPSAKPGITVITFKCKNNRCVWFDTGWLVQKNPDGSVPEPSDVPRGPKQFDRPDQFTVAQNMQQVEDYARFMQDRSTQQ